VRICLPEGAYAPRGTAGAGAPVNFAFGPYQQPDRCPNSSVVNFAVDRAAIVAANAGECGTIPGEGANFDAEGTGGWTFATSGTSTAGFVPGIGANGSRAARINMTQRCQTATMSTTLNVPSIANPALEMFIGGSAGVKATLSIGDGLFSMTPFDTVPIATTTRTLKMCLPPAMRGQVMNMGFFIDSSGACADVVNHQVFADNIRVVDDPACDAREGFTNGGLEHPGQVMGSFSGQDLTTSVALVRSTPGQAHGGTRYFSFESYRRCTGASYTVMPLVPAPSGAAGPALKFFANVGANLDATTSVSGRGVTAQTLTEGGGYRPYTVCLNPLYTGRPQILSFNHDGGSGACNNLNYGQQVALIDDITVTTDAICPVP
jgi:hypothetical protein